MEKCGVLECPVGGEPIVENNIASYFLTFNRQKELSF